MPVISNQYKTQFLMFLFDGFLVVYEMYAHVTKHSIQVCPRGMWLSMGIDVHLWWASIE